MIVECPAESRGIRNCGGLDFAGPRESLKTPSKFLAVLTIQIITGEVLPEVESEAEAVHSAMSRSC